MVLHTHAALVNQDTGEGYIPTFDEDGNLETPPEWVGTDEEHPFESEIVEESDLCDTPLSDWACTDADIPMSSALSSAALRAQLIDQLTTLVNEALNDLEITTDDYEPDEKVTDLRLFGTPQIAQLRCNGCNYTYIQCLQDGHPVNFCKRTTLNCTPGSSVVVTVSAQGMKLILGQPVWVNGSITITGSVTYREITTAGGGILPVMCLTVDSWTLTGFSPIQSIVHDQIANLLAAEGGTICTTLYNTCQ
jgi:hypothetical protein